MRFFLRILSLLYFIGFALHLADLFDGRLRFSEMNEIWRTWTVFLVVADFAAAFFLWRGSVVGICLFLTIAGAQLLAYTLAQNIFGPQWFLVGFHSATVLIFLFLWFRERKTAARDRDRS